MRDYTKKDVVEMEPLRMVLDRAGAPEIIALYQSIMSSFNNDPEGAAWLKDEENKEHSFIRVLQEIADIAQHAEKHTFKNEITQLLWNYHQQSGGGSPEKLFSQIEGVLWFEAPRLDGAVLSAVWEWLKEKGQISRDDFQWIYWKQLDELLEQDKEDAGQMLHLKQTFRRSQVKDLIQRRKECGAKLRKILKPPREDS